MENIGIMIIDCIGKGNHIDTVYDRALQSGCTPIYIGDQRLAISLISTENIPKLLNGIDYNTVEIKLFR